jgi:hypothetical protein
VTLIHAYAPCFEPAAADLRQNDAWFCYRELEDGSTYVRWGQLYEFNVRADGRVVICHALAEGNQRVLQNFLFGQVLSFALVAQGFEPLHAACVADDNAAFALIGDCTFGKSTLAAAFVDAGYRLLTDDLLLLDVNPPNLVAHTGTGRIKLQPDSARALLPSGSFGMALNPHTAKRSFLLDRNALRLASTPLRGIFVLPEPLQREEADQIDMRRLTATELFGHLLKNSLNVEVLDRERLARQFTFAAAVASRVGGWSLQYPRGLHHVRTVRDALINLVQRALEESHELTVEYRNAQVCA